METTVETIELHARAEKPTETFEVKSYEMNVVPKTIFLMVGPPNCGKSHFAAQMHFQLHGPFKSKIISSDELRRDILGDSKRDKFEAEMMSVSEGAFELLWKQLEVYTAFPNSYDFLFVDTTGIAKDFRDRVLDLAKKAHYNVEMILFNYKSIKDYYRMGANKQITSKMLLRMRQETLRELNTRSYRAVHKIKAISNPVVKYSENAMHWTHRNFSGKHTVLIGEIDAPRINTFVIGDVHGCFEELVELLAKKDFHVDPETLIIKDVLKSPEKKTIRHLVFVGDLIDKGPDSKKLIEFAYANIMQNNVTVSEGENPFAVYFVTCNHANFVFKYFNGMLSDVTPDVLAKFDSIPVLQEDPELLRKFNAYFKATIPYYRNRKVIVTHAPCENQYLEKGTEAAFKAMRNFRYPRKDEVTAPDMLPEQKDEAFNKALKDSLSFLDKDAVRNHPYHIFGHVSFKTIFQHKNKIGIDTGCYAGGRMSMVEIPHYQSKPFYHSVPSKQPLQEERLHETPSFHSGSLDVRMEDLEPSDLRRLRNMAYNKVNFVSGTVSPSTKNVEANDLESLEEGVKYYTDLGYTVLSVQPKYMGSRCNMYLKYDGKGTLLLDECYATSRQGFKIRQESLQEGLKGLYEYHGKRLSQSTVFEKRTTLAVLDGELMPWTAMGSGLIDRSFFPVRDAVNSEMDLLDSTGFEDCLRDLTNRMEKSGYLEDFSKLSKSELSSKYGNATYASYRAMSYFKFTSVAEHQKLNKVYSDQLDIFTADGDLSFRPWALLKTEHLNKEGELNVTVWNHALDFNKLSGENDFLYFPGMEAELRNFYNKLTEDVGMEGVVIKPLQGISNGKHAPFLKVRNPRYLTLVYGYDYTIPTKYEKLMRQKSTSKKMRVSAAEYQLGLKMLSIPHDQISMDNKEWLNYAAKMVLEEKNEVGLDPRL